MAADGVSVDDVIGFWFETLEPAQWYAQSDTLDAMIAARFGALHVAAARCELFDWRRSPKGRLAEIIALDQFSRNIFRGTAGAFAHDALALALAQEAVRAGADEALPAQQRAFLYLPYMHSESLAIHAVAMTLFAAPGLETNLDFERQQRATGKPHRRLYRAELLQICKTCEFAIHV